MVDEETLTIFPRVTVTVPKDGPPQISMSDDPSRVIKGRNAIAAHRREQSIEAEKAAFKTELERLKAERSFAVAYWRSYPRERLTEIEPKFKSSPTQLVGMIKDNSKLEDVLAKQENELAVLGLSPDVYANALFDLFEAYLFTGSEGQLVEASYGRYSEYNGYQVFRFGQAGDIQCPFGCQPPRTYTRDWVILKPDSKEAMIIADLHPHLILHGLFEEKPSRSDINKAALTKSQSPMDAMAEMAGQIFAHAFEYSMTSKFLDQGYRFLNANYYIPITSEVVRFLKLQA